MKSSFILSAYEKLENLSGKLPGPIHKAILHETTPLKNLFLRRRLARIVLLGDPIISKAAILKAFNENAVTAANRDQSEWETTVIEKRNAFQILDARALTLEKLKCSSLAKSADILLFVRNKTEIDIELTSELERCSALLPSVNTERDAAPAVLGLFFGSERERELFHAALATQSAIERRLATVVRFANDEDRAPFLAAVASALPDEAKLEFARSTGLAAIQREIAGTLIKSTTAVCAAIGTQPIPLADFPVLTSLQITMVSAIIYVSGLDLSKKLALQFLGALGVNFGLGIVLRQGSRALLKFLPLWGNAASGAIAGAGTYAIGRAASAYFIDKVTISEARNFLSWRKRKSLPPKSES